MGHGHRRSALSDESMSAFPDYAFADTEAQAAEERDAIEFLIDDYGNAIWMDERPRRIKMPEQAEPVLEKPIGYVECPVDHEPDPREMVDGVYDPGANEVTESTLQRPLFGERYTRKDGTQGKSGGGGASGGGKAKGLKRGRVPYDESGFGEQDVVEFCVYGLTVGEREFYRNRPGTAADVLIQIAEALNSGVGVLEGAINEERFERERRAKMLKVDFAVYGLTKDQADTLRDYTGAARAALAVYARQHDGDRIARREIDEAA